jgi:hypothetical protein
MWSSSPAAVFAAIAASLGMAATARADKAAAEAAFAEAKRLMAAGKVTEACPRFELSHKEDPQLGTLLNLADCHEQDGKLATAWAEFRAAMELAQNRGDPREAFARERSEQLAPRISHVVLVRSGDPDGLIVLLDGRDVTTLIGVPIPVDPGEHVIATRTAGEGELRSTVKAGKEGGDLEVRVPLERDEPDDGVAPQGGGARRAAGLATAGVGLLATGIGLYFGKRSFDRYDQSRAFCTEANVCEPEGARLIDDARASATVANVLVGVGVGALVVGTIVWLTAPKERAAQVASPGSAGTRSTCRTQCGGRTVSGRPIVTPHVIGGALSVQF